MAQSAQRSNILLLVVELCSLTFRKQDRPKSKIVATALFGDGAFAAVITSRPRVRPRWRHAQTDRLLTNSYACQSFFGTGP